MTDDKLSALLRDVLRLERDIRRHPGFSEETARRLRDSVIAPLRGVAGTPADGADDSGPPETRLWTLARTATELRVQAAGQASTALKEATATLQALSLQASHDEDAGTAEKRLAELRDLSAGLDSEIEVARDGPYLATNVELHTWLGEPLTTAPQVALCRCGASAAKPLCDGSHTRTGFSGDKDPKRVPDEREAYPGVQVTVLDNRGTCAHSGFCTDRLATVFRLGQEPFVAPSGGRMDEIVSAVRACPSGALSFALDGREQRQVVDETRKPAIEVSKDGPYRITGAIRLVEDGGAEPQRNQGASLEHYSLCRCGHSLNKPFCSGMHWNTPFKDPVRDPDVEETLFEWVGGLPALTRMTRLFYEKYVPQDPLIGPLFASMAPDHPIRVAKWLGEVFGGPHAYTHDYGGYDRMISQHMGKGLTEDQRARWVSLMCLAADQAGVPNDAEFRAAFVAYLEWGSRIAVENSQTAAKPPKSMPVPRWWWVCNATPGARVSALAVQEEEEPVTLPAPGDDVRYGEHIKPLFRARDRNAMKFALDLWSYTDVKSHAPEILSRLRSGSMPCDGAWPKDRIAVFARWLETDMPE
ncbi:CDGSH iron-sulfur domain-containing protein [Streptosporangium soli]|nr:CDGSH iron-sulfur domain-containing protein [Streptosporangium sp. KLBMP 9127]